MTTEHSDPTQNEHISTKLCVQCGEMKPLNEFLRRTGRRAGAQGRRGTCRDCRRGLPAVQADPPKAAARHAHHAGAAKSAAARNGVGSGDGAAAALAAMANAPASESPNAGGTAVPSVPQGRRSRGAGAPQQDVLPAAQEAASASHPAGSATAAPRKQPRRQAPSPSATEGEEAPAASAPGDPSARKQRGRSRKRRTGAAARQLAEPPKRGTHDPADASFLRTTASGFIRMRGKTDNGRRWYQEVEFDLAQILVKEGAAVVVNRSTIRRLYSNKEFRKLILTRDNYTCRFCGKYGDTIDHELPRAKGGHTTPVNCVCACYECNQLKANRDADEFRSTLE
ncbi:HNH endonuclease [Paenibacillus sp. LHD-117]|uniref:HNH endonuclease n=1 Tax=Paenibacillus sp. LHD-117 TaxID=3071412 RepID=UPI0027E09BA5|nr:HNH endonuclease [Paenibacillus sp. LHD-117]MDQ6418861.1 HNH endonuclease [Paenibacillus sp. LHD-117]